jgi:peptidoglycan/xylan/chitin deacetylase (PgdA/CDA1 family)
VERRQFLSLLAAGVATAGLGVAGAEFGPRAFGENGWLSGVGGVQAEGEPTLTSAENLAAYEQTTILPGGFGEEIPTFDSPTTKKVKVPGGTISSIKGNPGMVALTVDDGVSSAVVREYAKFSKRTGMRLTFFVTGMYASWRDNADLLKPLIESGQIQMANHTWTHPTLTKLTDGQIVSELKQTHDFLANTFGIQAAPYFRPPYGTHDSRVDRVAASIGYSTPVMWNGSLSDSTVLTDAQVQQFATKYMTSESIVIGHANYTPITNNFDFIRDLIRKRAITPVTLNDIYLKA